MKRYSRRTWRFALVYLFMLYQSKPHHYPLSYAVGHPVLVPGEPRVLATLVEADKRSTTSPLASETATRLSPLSSWRETVRGSRDLGRETLARAEKSSRGREATQDTQVGL